MNSDFFRNLWKQPRRRFSLLTALLYLLFFALLFLQFPLSGRIGGNCDSWLAITLSNLWWKSLLSWTGIHPIGTSLFPEASPLLFGESSPAGAVLFLGAKLLTAGNDLWAYWLFITFIFAGTAWGLFRLSWQISRHRSASLLAGFLGAVSNFLFANMDDTLLVFLLPFSLAVIRLFRYGNTGEFRHLRAAAFFSALQMYFSVYLFLYLGFFWLFFFIPKIRLLLREPRRFLLAGSLIIALILPLLSMYLYSHYKAGVVNPWDAVKMYDFNTLQPSDYLKQLPGNLLYRDVPESLAGFFWTKLRSHAFTGLLWWILTLGGFFAMRRHRWLAIVLFIQGILLSFGPTVEIGGKFISLPMKWFGDAFDLLLYLRVGLRGFLLSFPAAALLQAASLGFIFRRLRSAHRFTIPVIFLAFLSIHTLENTAMPLPAFDAEKFMEQPEIFRHIRDKQAVILDLPSRAGRVFADSERDLFNYNREIIYMYWQLRHGFNIAGGVNGYFPRSRMRLDEELSANPPDWKRLMSAHRITHIILHRNMILPGEENLLALLQAAPYLEKTAETPDAVLFRIRPATENRK